eukprot:CAMPEP_0117480760 /NCGR_PEP_ID=MMETSP0784-20121206/12553_1 /TAXON_ID=39447 /ORGANISM="" /LENGTH=47 /DNA_ID= /DNA_START= /DNA_END= /DNA_ORIENTATION=
MQLFCTVQAPQRAYNVVEPGVNAVFDAPLDAFDVPQDHLEPEPISVG